MFLITFSLDPPQQRCSCLHCRLGSDLPAQLKQVRIVRIQGILEQHPADLFPVLVVDDHAIGLHDPEFITDGMTLFLRRGSISSSGRMKALMEPTKFFLPVVQGVGQIHGQKASNAGNHC